MSRLISCRNSIGSIFLVVLVFLPDASESSELLVYNHGTLSILKFDGRTGQFLFEFERPAPQADYQGMALGSDGVLYVASGGVDTIHRFDPKTGLQTQLLTSGGSLNHPAHLAIGPDDLLYISNRDGDSVTRFRIDSVLGEDLGNFVSPGSGGLDAPNGLAFDGHGDLYVASRITGNVLRYDGETGAFLEEFVTSGSGGLQEPTGIVFGPDSHLYVCDRTGDAILRYHGKSGEFLDEFVSPMEGGTDTPASAVFGRDGLLYISSGGSDEVLRFEGSGAFADAFITSGTEGLDSNSTLLFLETPSPAGINEWSLNR